MVARLTPVSLDFAPYALQAQLLAKAGEATGNAIAGVGQDIAQGVTRGLAVRREKKDRADSMALRQQELAQRTADRDTDNARLEAQLKITAAERAQTALQTRLLKITEQRDSAQALGMDTSEYDKQLGVIQSSHDAQQANVDSAIEKLHAVAHPDCLGGH